MLGAKKELGRGAFGEKCVYLQRVANWQFFVVPL